MTLEELLPQLGLGMLSQPPGFDPAAPMPLPDPAVGAGGALPPAAAPAAAPAPAAMTPPAAGGISSLLGGGGLMGPVSKLLSPNNAPMLLALAGGFAGAPSFGTGMRRGFSAAAPLLQQQQQSQLALEQKNQGPRATYGALIAAGVPPGEALAASHNPELLKQVSEKYLNKNAERPATEEERKLYQVAPGHPLAIETATGKPRFGPAQTNVTVDKGENKFDEGIYASNVKLFESVMADANTAADTAKNYDLIGQLLLHPDVNTGTLGPLAATIKKAAKTVLGLDIEGVSNAEMAEKLRVGALAKLKTLLPGPMSDSDRKTLLDLPPNLGSSAEAIALTVALAKEAAAAQERRADKLREIMGRNEKRRLDVDGRLEFEKWAREQPIFSPDTIAKAKMAATQQGPFAGTGGPGQLRDYFLGGGGR